MERAGLSDETVVVSGSVDNAREAFARQAWGEAYAALAECGSLEVEDLERLAVAAHLVGRDDESARAWQRAHVDWVASGDPDRAAQCAFWLGFCLLLRGETAPANGWLARTSRLIDDMDGECAAQGYLQVVVALEATESGDPETARTVTAEIVEIAERFDEADLLAFGRLCRGQAALALGDTAGGMQLLDEAMVAVATGEVAPIAAGIVYCAVIEACMDVFDLRRAAEWTEALDRWCDAQPDLVPFRGQCRVHRSQLFQAHGAWADATSEAELARHRLSEPAHPALGLALYQQGELHRLRGEFAAAKRAYRAASEQGRDPVPGWALLRLAEDRVDAAVIAIRRTVEESRGQLRHPAVLAACVDIMVAADEVGEARSALDRLTKIDDAVDAPLLHAITAYAAGSVLLRLDAQPDMASLQKLTGSERLARPGRLTERECQVLREVAAGKTDREIAAALVISEHTVGRHLQNIFSKIDVSSRAGATGYAYEQGLV